MAFSFSILNAIKVRQVSSQFLYIGRSIFVYDQCVDVYDII